MMPLPYDPVFDAIQAYLGYTDLVSGDWVAGAWDTTLARLIYENEGDDAPAGGMAWVQITIDTALYAQQSIGGGEGQADNRWDEDGTIWFHVFTPRGTGSREARRIAKGLANLFRGTVLMNGLLEFLDADMGAGDPGAENANFYLLSVSVGWRLIDAQ